MAETEEIQRYSDDEEHPPWPDQRHGDWVDYNDHLAALAAMQERKRVAYAERNQLVRALSKCFPAWLERHPDEDVEWEDDWRWIVFIQAPAGQMSWHIHDSELYWFSRLERRDGNSWDGHTTEEKYKRLADIEPLAAREVEVRKAEQERCAGTAIDIQQANQVEVVDAYDRGYSNACGDIAAAIRALEDENGEG